MPTRRFLMQAALAAAVSPGTGGEKAATKLFSEQALYLPRSEWYRTKLASDPASAPAYAQQYAQGLAMQGDELGAWRATRAAFGPPRPSAAPDLTQVHGVDAVEAVVRALGRRRVVSINDDHPTSLTRAFAHRLALRLSQEGFNLLAAETFNYSDDFARLNASRGPVTSNIGYYASDPVYAEMLRDLRDRGWTFAAYENRPDQANLTDAAGAKLSAFEAREEAQARNLAALIRADPSRKVLIFSGEGHAAKHSPYKLMGERLAGMGVDFVAATQIYGLPAPDPADDSPLVAAALARLHPAGPVALVRGDGAPFYTRDPRAYDVFIVHPHLPPVDGRPGWLASAPARRPASAPLPAGLPAGALVQAVPRDEAVRAVNVIPSDQYPLPGAGVRRTSFFLRPGGYLVRVETLEGRREVGRLDVPAAA